MESTTVCHFPPVPIPHTALPCHVDVAAETPPRNGEHPVPLHRLGEVRRREGITRHAMAARLGLSDAEVQKRERPCCDMLLSELHRWGDAMQVPMAELLNEPDNQLSPGVRLRAQLLRAMKTVRSIEERAKQPSVRRLAGTLVDQIAEIMPELRDIGAWPSVGKRRTLKEPGQAYFRHFWVEGIDDLDEFES